MTTTRLEPEELEGPMEPDCVEELEDFALRRAIEEGAEGREVSREEVFAVLSGGGPK